jgi:hypothetical protein
MASAPPSTIRIAQTVAKTGRRMKKSTNKSVFRLSRVEAQSKTKLD